MNYDGLQIARDGFLAARSPFNVYLAEISSYPLLSRKAEYDVACLAHDREDPAAVEKLITSNLRLVVKIALDYYNTHLEILDLIQEGNLGLLQAVRKYDPHKGAKFSVYASFWIRAYILQYIRDTWSVVKVGTTRSERMLFFRLNSDREGAGICSSSELLARDFGLKEEEFAAVRQRFASPDVSLDDPLHEETGDTLMDTIGADENIEETVSSIEECDILSKMIADFKGSLSDKETLVFDHRIMSEEPASLREIGDRLQISHERVRQIEHKVIDKLNQRVREQRIVVGI
jgi:RNA polymerase sigma-32 factor